MLRIKQVHRTLKFLTLGVATIVTLAPITSAVAQQVSTDGTVSTTVTTPDGKNFTINDGTTRGGNLFHSFKEFSVPNGGSANFNNAANIQNIINRVTGGSVSSIDGLIKANGAANVFLLNPAGIIFGPNASLNIGGSFLGSTANSFLFDNGFEFSATDPQAPPLLTINVPIGLRYRDNPQPIQVIGPEHGRNFSDFTDRIRQNIDSNVIGLKVEPGKTLALVGGNVSLEGGVLRSPGGRIEIGSFDSNQVVNLVPAEQGFSLAYQGTPSFRNIEFSKKSLANVTGEGSGSIAIKGRTINFNSESVLLANTLGDKNGGEISIVGDSINFNRSGVFSNTFSSGDSGRIKLDATNNIEFKDSSTLTIQTWDKGKAGDININANSFGLEGVIKSEVQEGSTGQGGNINITANSLEVLQNLQNPQDKATVISTATFGKGDAGNINIDVKGPFTLVGSIVTNSSGAGNAGKVNISANSLGMERSFLASRATNTGQAGKIDLNVANSLAIKDSTIITSTFDGTGEAGTININANSFRFVGEADIRSEAQGNSTGRGGKINITANSLEVLQNPQQVKPTLITTATFGKGDAGDININVKGPFTLTGPISTESRGAGNAGKIKINANSLQIDGTSVSSSAKNTGQGGEISFNVADSLAIKNSTISTNTSGTGDAGKINISANSFRLGGEIKSETEKGSTGKAGVININANSLEVLQNPPDTAVISTTTKGKGDAGDINITVTGSLTVAGGANIKTDSSDTSNSNAGNLRIKADTIKLDNSSLNADTNGGEGNISVNSRDLILRNNGKITTNATGTANGGNIEINNTGNLVVFEGSKITANAEKGYGGRVNITARGIFRSPDSDITATSEAGPQFNGIVQFNTPDVDPSRGLFELSETVIDPAQQIAQNVCTKGFGSSFTITGRGGFSSDPTKILSSDNVRVDLVKPVPSTVSSTSTTQKQPSQKPPVKEIIPARGWIYNEKGEVLLVAYDPTKTGPQRKQPAPASSCAATR
ncbi:filamentous hemagglutinin N-terminal domain-containing protein [Scytonema tolypothrichoides VB-61278]|nr:filamentous hemagglutinin N-terminal domain-containing protein [Scytonema tolypothrichoides VB-61278]